MIGSKETGMLRFFVVVCVVFCGILMGETAASSQSDSSAAASFTQTDPAAAGAQSSASYIIGSDDVLSINVWKEPDITRSVTVRSDGKISLPLVGELQAAGRTPSQLEKDITADLRSYIAEPQVSVIVQEANSQKFNILGQVTKPGSYSLTAGLTIVDAIADAGGFRDFAKKKSVYILRQDGSGHSTRIAFDYERFIKGKDTAQNIKLKPHDTIIVP